MLEEFVQVLLVKQPMQWPMQPAESILRRLQHLPCDQAEENLQMVALTSHCEASLCTQLFAVQIANAAGA